MLTTSHETPNKSNGKSPQKARLTNRQQQIYEFLQQRIRASGYAPSVREIGEYFSIRSPNGVVCHLRALEKKGVIRRDKNVSRAIALTCENQSLQLPLMGEIYHNAPFAQAEGTESPVDLNQSLTGSRKHAIRICLLYTSPSPRDRQKSRMPSSA